MIGSAPTTARQQQRKDARGNTKGVTRVLHGLHEPAREALDAARDQRRVLQGCGQRGKGRGNERTMTATARAHESARGRVHRCTTTRTARSEGSPPSSCHLLPSPPVRGPAGGRAGHWHCQWHWHWHCQWHWQSGRWLVPAAPSRCALLLVCLWTQKLGCPKNVGTIFVMCVVFLSAVQGALHTP